MIDTVCIICKVHQSPAFARQDLSRVRCKAVMARRITTTDLTKTARKAAWVLFSYIPVAGLQSLAEVSAKADIHARSIICNATQLGLVGYPKYQKSFNRGIDK